MMTLRYVIICAALVVGAMPASAQTRPARGFQRPVPAVQPPARPLPGRPGPGMGGRPPIGGGPYRPPHGGHQGPPAHHHMPYRYPHGYHYRRWHAGLLLPHVLFGSTYWFQDYYRYGLPHPPHSYRWVRYGPDLLLVNTHTGHIRDVRHGLLD
jgi:hypothetical protein